MGLIAGKIRTTDWQAKNVDRLGDLSDVIPATVKPYGNVRIVGAY